MLKWHIPVPSHDVDSTSLSRLRVEGFNVVDRPRPRSPSNVDTLTTNHGGVAVVSTPGIRLTQLDLGVNFGSFEMLCVRITSVSSSCVAVLIYRPPSASVSAFVSELSDVLDRVVTFSDPLFVVGDVNIHMECDDDPDTRQFVDALNVRGLVCHATPPTHDCGGTIDIVVTRSDLPAPLIDVINIGLSDHRLLQWPMEFARPSPVYSSVTRRSWRQLDPDEFRNSDLRNSVFRHSDTIP